MNRIRRRPAVKSARSRRKNTEKKTGGANPMPRQAGFTAVSVRGIPLFPSKYKAMLRYYEDVNITSSSPTAVAYLFSANGLYDPNITGTGHQPMGFDQMILSYEHYTVLSAKIVIFAKNFSSTGSPVVALSIAPSNTAMTNAQQIMESGMVAVVHLNCGPGYGCIQQLKQAVNIAKFGGYVNVIDNPEYQGTSAANPTDQTYFHVYSWENSSISSTIELRVCIEYEAVFHEPKKLTQSLLQAMHEFNTAIPPSPPVRRSTAPLTRAVKPQLPPLTRGSRVDERKYTRPEEDDGYVL